MEKEKEKGYISRWLESKKIDLKDKELSIELIVLLIHRRKQSFDSVKTEIFKGYEDRYNEVMDDLRKNNIIEEGCEPLLYVDIPFRLIKEISDFIKKDRG